MGVSKHSVLSSFQLILLVGIILSETKRAIIVPFVSERFQKSAQFNCLVSLDVAMLVVHRQAPVFYNVKSTVSDPPLFV